VTMIVLVDTTNIAYRANAMLRLSSESGDVSAVYGTLLSIRHVLKKFGPCRLYCFWDVGKSWRSRYYPQYKANRATKFSEEDKADIYRQIKLIHPLLASLGVTQLSKVGYEADDLIAYCCQSMDGSKIIVSGDRDLVQLVDDQTHLYYLPKKVLVDRSNCKTIMGLAPKQYLHKCILKGDPSDNVKGIAGVGEILATEIVKTVGTSNWTIIQQKLEHLPPKLRKHLDNPEVPSIISRNTKLMRLGKANIHIPSRMLRKPQMNRSRFRELCVEHRFVSLLEDTNGWLDSFYRLQSE